MLGIHLSIAGGPHNALREARALGADCVQIFTRNQRQWHSEPLSAEALALWRSEREAAGLAGHVGHASYLINLASPDDALWERSIGAYREELGRAEALGLSALVVHPGAHMGTGEPAGIARVAAALDRLGAEGPELAVSACLETTAGQGTSLGWRLEHLAAILGAVAEPDRLSVCLDSAHLLAAGYAMDSPAGVRAVLREVRTVLGPKRVAVVHVNDSRTPRGGRVDRHAHLGQGHIPLEAFAALVNAPSLRAVPKILETPKAITDGGESWDAVNLRTLRGLWRGR